MWESFVHHTKGVDVILFVLMKSNALRGCGLFQLSQTLKEREKSISVTWMTPVTTPCLTVLFEFIWAGRQVWSSVGGGCIGQARNKKGLPGPGGGTGTSQTQRWSLTVNTLPCNFMKTQKRHLEIYSTRIHLFQFSQPSFATGTALFCLNSKVFIFFTC